MTGAYLRIERDKKWDSIEVEHLTDEERDSIFQFRDKEEILRWFNLVCNKLKEVENEYFQNEN